MREIRLSGSVEGGMSDHDPYFDYYKSVCSYRRSVSVFVGWAYVPPGRRRLPGPEHQPKVTAWLTLHSLFHMLHQRKNHRTFGGNEHILLEAAGLLQAWVPGEGLDGKVHILLDLRGILHRVGARDPHPLVQRDTDAMGELLQGHRRVSIVIVLGESRRHVGRGIARLQSFQARIHRVVDFAVQVDLFLGHFQPLNPTALEAPHEIDEVTRRTHGVDVHDDQITLPNQLVGRPPPVRAGVAAGSHDDVVDDLAPALQHELVHFRFDFALAHAGLQPLVLDLPHGRVANARGLLEQFDLIAGLHHARRRNRRPPINHPDACLLESLQSRHVEVVDADSFLGHAVLFQHFEDALRHPPSHVWDGALGPLPSNGRTNPPLHPRQVDLRALQIGTGGFE